MLKTLKGSPDWQEVTVQLSELAADDPKIAAPLANWQTVTEFSLSPSGSIVKDGQKVNITGKAWKGPREIRNLRWEGGTYSQQAATGAPVSDEELQKSFNKAIKKSLEQEKADQRAK